LLVFFCVWSAHVDGFFGTQSFKSGSCQSLLLSVNADSFKI